MLASSVQLAETALARASTQLSPALPVVVSNVVLTRPLANGLQKGGDTKIKVQI
jgi:hypothetical protein